MGHSSEELEKSDFLGLKDLCMFEAGRTSNNLALKVELERTPNVDGPAHFQGSIVNHRMTSAGDTESYCERI